nr:phage holin family protein [Arthrobacter sp. ov407]
MSSEIPEMPPTAQAKADANSLGDLLGDVTRDLSTLMHQEVELAKVEAKQSVARAARGGGMLAGAGVAGHFVLLFLSIALWYGIGMEWTGFVWSAVIVALLWGVVAAILAARGRKELKTVEGMPQTAETLQEIPPTLKPNEDHR